MSKPEQTILVTGINGFVGEHLTNELVSNGHTVIGAGIQDEIAPAISDKVHSYFTCDLTVADQVDELPWASIDSVIHLAGLSAVGASFDNPELYMRINTGVLKGLFEGAIRAGEKRPRIISVSTGALYAPSETPITEDSVTQMTSPYAESKFTSEQILKEYRAGEFSDAVSLRPFNHIGPGQGPGFLIPDLGLQIHDAEPNAKIMVGNIKTSRDYTDVRDVVRAYRMVAEADSTDSELYNICSGNPLTGEQVLDTLKKAMGRDDVTIEIDPAKIRPTDNMYVCGSAERIKNDIGWSAEIPFDTSIQDFADSLK